MVFQQAPFLAVVSALAFGHLSDLICVQQKGFGHLGEGLSVEVLAFTHSVAQLEVPVCCDLGGGMNGVFASCVNQALALQERPRINLGPAVTTFQSQLAVIE